jgi:hypothetical protein
MNEIESFGYLIAGIISEDKNLITYRKSLRPLAGSVTATILLQQMIFHAKNKQWEPFYKFRAPCSHEHYREGDSWTEELGFSGDEFDTALRRIATKVTKGSSKFDVLAGEDSKCLILYWTDADRVTWYQVNVRLLGKLTMPIYLGNLAIPNYLGNQEKPNYLENGESPITYSYRDYIKDYNRGGGGAVTRPRCHFESLFRNVPRRGNRPSRTSAQSPDH